MIMQRLSPLTRGTHGNGCDRQRDPRFIPAARGTLDESSSNNDCAGFIPAGAGNTRILAALAPDEAVYPRWRGEHAEIACSLSKFAGLSPLARGTPVGERFLSWDERFTPAGAGNTVVEKKFLCRFSVYPRWRGEHIASPVAKN